MAVSASAGIAADPPGRGRAVAPARGLRALLARLAARAPLGVFAAVGDGAAARVDDLLLDADLVRAASPRHADVLLVAGRLRDADLAALRVLHDQLPRSRATLWWGAEPIDGVDAPAVVALADDPLPWLRAQRDRRGAGAACGEPDWQPDEPPAPWRGVGENGQGGDGMMGGKPYGRPMAMTDDDLRDGLALDATTLRLGPFAPMLPPGLVLELTLQGDVIQRARVERAAFAAAAAGGEAPAPAGLRRAAHLLDLLELPALAGRCRRAARDGDAGAPIDLAALDRAVRRSAAFAAIPPGLGRAPADAGGDDVRARLARWLRGAAPEPGGAAPAVALAALLRGLEWNEAMLVVASFDPARLAPPPGRDAAPSDAAAADDRDAGAAPTTRAAR